eukprot:Rhum_TRINITY_DN15554_c0_g1::Rhum_TRINITY_DN15554_c0_g1_i1::g.161207::m.161207
MEARRPKKKTQVLGRTPGWSPLLLPFHATSSLVALLGLGSVSRLDLLEVLHRVRRACDDVRQEVHVDKLRQHAHAGRVVPLVAHARAAHSPEQRVGDRLRARRRGAEEGQRVEAVRALVEVRLHRRRVHHAHVDAVHAHLRRQRRGELGEVALGRAVQHAERRRHEPGGRRREGHAALKPLLLHLAHEVVRDLHDGGRVAVVVGDAGGERGGREEAGLDVAGVVEQERDVDVPRRLDEGREEVGARKVEADGAELEAGVRLLVLSDGRVQQGVRVRHNNDVQPLGRKLLDDGTADAAGAARDKRPLGLVLAVLLLEVLVAGEDEDKPRDEVRQQGGAAHEGAHSPPEVPQRDEGQHFSFPLVFFLDSRGAQ